MSIPTITGTEAGQTVSVGSTIDPFANATAVDINSENLGGGNGGPDFVSPIATISLSGSGGSLALGNNSAVSLSNNGNGSYTLSVNSPAELTQTNDDTLNQALHGLSFIPTSDGTTTFSVYMTDKYGENTTNSTTTVIANGSGSPATAPTTTAPTTTPDTTTTTDTTTPDTTAANDVTISGRVARGTTETVSNDSVLTVDHPHRFHGQADLTSGVIDLNGLATADSYYFKNDMLSIYSGGNVIDTLAFTSGSSAFSVEKTDSGISIYTGDDTRHLAGTLLAAHVG